MLLSIADVDAGKLESEMTESAVSKAHHRYQNFFVAVSQLP
jgi:hypothetical protein